MKIESTLQRRFYLSTSVQREGAVGTDIEKCKAQKFPLALEMTAMKRRHTMEKEQHKGVDTRTLTKKVPFKRGVPVTSRFSRDD